MHELIPPTPDGIDRELLSDFIGSRREAKKPMTQTAIKRLVNKLGRLDAAGHCPNKLLERSIINGWQDVWPDESTMKVVRQTSDFISRHTDRSWADGL